MKAKLKEFLGMKLLFNLIPFLAILLTGCSTKIPSLDSHSTNAQAIEKDIPIYLPPFINTLDVSSELENIYQLTSTQKEHFTAFFDSPAQVEFPRHQRLANYLNLITQNYTYYDRTYNASESLLRQQGNCMSLAIVTTALAKLANIDIDYQLVNALPVYDKKDNVVIRGRHVRSIIYDPDYQPKPGVIALLKPRIVIDYFPEIDSHIDRAITDDEFIAIYLNNIAVESYLEKNYERAFTLSLQSINIYAQNPEAANLMALIYEQWQLDSHAENMYRFGIQRFDNKIELLGNYYHWLKKQNRVIEAEKIKEQLDELAVPNPFDWLEIAYKAYDRRNWNFAEKHFKKVIRFAPYLHHGYVGLAMVKTQQGRLKEARSLMEKALEVTYDKETKQRYHAKLQALRFSN